VEEDPGGGIAYHGHGRDEQGRPTYTYGIGIPGVYWDPRI